MRDPLCQFGHNFPPLTAQILHRDRRKTRNFREETVTDLLMAGLTAFEPLGIRVDFPVDESKTGEDMDWEFVAPHAKDGRCYLRLHIQAKRAIQKILKRDPSYWFYRELDHEAQKHSGHGSQAQRLIREAKALRGCVPLYMFYHTLDALEPEDKASALPAVEGVNVMFAQALASALRTYPPTQGNKRWPIAEKKVGTWRPQFMPLSDLLCFNSISGWIGWHLSIFDDENGIPRFVFAASDGLFSPGALADRLNARRDEFAALTGEDFEPIEAIQDIPPETMKAVENWSDKPGLAEIPRPRAIFLHRGEEAPSRDTEGTPRDA